MTLGIEGNTLSNVGLGLGHLYNLMLWKQQKRDNFSSAFRFVCLFLNQSDFKCSVVNLNQTGFLPSGECLYKDQGQCSFKANNRENAVVYFNNHCLHSVKLTLCLFMHLSFPLQSAQQIPNGV